jgi:predicted alpha/beta superfamily hydrolase
MILSIIFCSLPGILTAMTVTGPGITGRVDRYEHFTSRFVAARTIDVWLPPGYATSDRERYSVIYMHDGQNLFDPSTSFGGHDWGVDEMMTQLIAEGRIRKAIIVGIWNSAQRVAEFMPRKATTFTRVDSLPDVLPTGFGPILADEYLTFVVMEVKTFVDSTYRTMPDQQHTFIMGSSRGGLISAYAVCEYPDVFRGAGCLSTHWPVDNGSMIEYLRAHLPDPGTHQFYFDRGTIGLDSLYEPYQDRMDVVMQRAGYTAGANWTSRVFPGGEHSEVFWRKRVDIPLLFFLHK